MKKQRTFLAVITSFFMILGMATVGFAASNIELEERIQALESGQGSGAPGVMGQISDRITLSGAIELDFSYNDTNGHSESELELGTAELGFEVALHKYVTGFALLSMEDGENAIWDEVTFTFQSDDFPVYLVAGKRTQPFGVFESMFINDSLLQEPFEIAETGVTIGFTDEDLMGLDTSFTLYKGGESDTVEAFILNLGVAPMESLALSLSYVSEPGLVDRNTALGGAVHFEAGSFLFDGEYITQLDSEDDVEIDGWTMALGFQVTDPLLIAIRYEGLDAGIEDSDEGDLTCYAIGVTYTLFETDFFACSLMGEYSRSEVELADGENEDVDGFFAKIALEF